VSGVGPLVHLIDPHGPGASRWLATLALRSGQGVVVALGHSAGHPCAHRVPVAASWSVTARTLERLLEDCEAAHLVAWGARAAAIASASRDRAGRWFMLDGVPRTRSIPFDAEVLCLGEAVADAALQAGWPPMRVRAVQPPAPLAAAWDTDGSLRAGHRDRWGAAPGSIVVAMLPAGPGEGDAMTALDVVGRAHLAGVDARLVLHPDTGGAAAMQVFARRAGLRDRVRFDEGLAAPEPLAPAVDAWLSLPDPTQDGTALDPAAVGGLGGCLLALEGSRAAAAIDVGVDGLVAKGCNALAAELLSLAESPARRTEIAQAARARHATEGRFQAFRELLAGIAARDGIREANPSAASA
jgi:hypothetical protein